MALRLRRLLDLLGECRVVLDQLQAHVRELRTVRTHIPGKDFGS